MASGYSNGYSRTYDAHSTDSDHSDTDTRQKRSVLKHKNSNKRSNKNSSNGETTMKPCLVHKNSVTSDDEISSNLNTSLNSNSEANIVDFSNESIQMNDTNDLNSINQTTPNNQHITRQGILKQSSRETSSNEAEISSNSQTQQQQQQQQAQKPKMYKSNIPLPKNSQKNPSSPISISNSPNNDAKSLKPLALKYNSDNRITLVVDDTRFIVDPELFKQHSNTMLGRMFSSTLENKPNERGEYAVAYGISSTIFKAVLDFYRHGVLKCPSNVSIQELKEACDYLLIPFDGKTIRCHDLRGLLHE